MQWMELCLMVENSGYRWPDMVDQQNHTDEDLPEDMVVADIEEDHILDQGPGLGLQDAEVADIHAVEVGHMIVDPGVVVEAGVVQEVGQGHIGPQSRGLGHLPKKHRKTTIQNERTLTKLEDQQSQLAACRIDSLPVAVLQTGYYHIGHYKNKRKHAVW